MYEYRLLAFDRLGGEGEERVGVGRLLHLPGLDEVLDAGWEPVGFSSAGTSDIGHFVWLRRPRQTAEATPPVG